MVSLIGNKKPCQYKLLMERERCGKFDKKLIKSTAEPFPVSTGTIPVEQIKSPGFVNCAVSPFERNAQRWSKNSTVKALNFKVAITSKTCQ